MNKSTILLFKIGIISSIIGSILFSVFVLPALLKYSSNNVDELTVLKFIYYPIVFEFHVPLIVSLSQAYRLVLLLDTDKLFDSEVSKKMNVVKYSGLSIAGLHFLAIILLLLFGYHFMMVLLSSMVVIVSVIISSFIHLLQIVFSQSTIIKEENDLTI